MLETLIVIGAIGVAAAASRPTGDVYGRGSLFPPPNVRDASDLRLEPNVPGPFLPRSGYTEESSDTDRLRHVFSTLGVAEAVGMEIVAAARSFLVEHGVGRWSVDPMVVHDLEEERVFATIRFRVNAAQGDVYALDDGLTEHLVDSFDSLPESLSLAVCTEE